MSKLYETITPILLRIYQKSKPSKPDLRKLSIQQDSDDVSNAYSLELTEDDFQLSDTFQAMVVFASVFTLVYIFGLKSFKS
jgi:hypothetical protein